MATILLVESAPNLGLYEAGLLEDRGHVVIRCRGAPTPSSACPLMRDASCSLAASADVIIFSCGLIAPVWSRSYRGVDLLRGYRSHARFGKIPMVVVAYGIPDDLEGAGPLVRLDKFAGPDALLEAVDRVLQPCQNAGG